MQCCTLSLVTTRAGVLRLPTMIGASLRHAHTVVPTALGQSGGSRRVMNKVLSNTPLRSRDPASRSVMLPDSFHSRRNTDDYDDPTGESKGDNQTHNYTRKRRHRHRSALLSGDNNMDDGKDITAEDAKKRAKVILMKQLAAEALWQGHVFNDMRSPLIQHFKEGRNSARFRDAKKMVVMSSRNLMKEIAEKEGIYPKTLLLVTRVESDYSRRNSNNNDGTRFTPDDAKYLSNAAKDGCEIIKVSPKVAEEIEPGNDGFIGDFTMPEPPPVEDIIANRFLFKRILVLDNVDDPGHLGTLLRTSAAMDYDAVFMINHCADLYHHAVLRAARGVHFMRGARFYVLKEENGDDAFGMINYVIKRNKMDVVAFTPLPFEVSAKRKMLDATTRHESNTIRYQSNYPPKNEVMSHIPTQHPSSPANISISPVTPSECADEKSNVLNSIPCSKNTIVGDTQFMQTTSQEKDSSTLLTSKQQSATPQHNHPNAAKVEKLANFLKSRFSDPFTNGKPKYDGKTSNSYSGTTYNTNHSNDKPSPQAIADKGFLVMIGPDHKRNLIRKMEQKVIRPATVLQLDTMSESNFMVAVPVILYAMRPFGQYDYVPSFEKQKMYPAIAASTASERQPLSVKEKLRAYKAQRHSLDHVQIGHEHLSPPIKSYDEDEQIAAAEEKMHWKVQSRELRRRRSDYGLFLEYQMKKIKHHANRAKVDAMSPLTKYTGSGMSFFNKSPPVEPDWLPNITTDYMEGVGRDSLRQEAEDAVERGDNDVLMHGSCETVLEHPTSRRAWESSGALRNPR